jgi:hypothetical protein
MGTNAKIITVSGNVNEHLFTKETGNVELITITRAREQPKGLAVILDAVHSGWSELGSGKIKLAEYLKRFPDEVSEWIFDSSASPHDANPLDRTQLMFNMWRDTLQQLARGEEDIRVSVRVKRDRQGQLSRTGEPLNQIILFSDWDVRYLRECAICGRIFWAKRLTNEQLNNSRAPIGCEAECQNNLRVQRARFLRENGFLAGAKLKAKDRHKKAQLLRNWFPTKRADEAQTR